MTCPYCGSKTAVIDTADLDVIIYRKRKCCECSCTFYTVEQDSDVETAEQEIKNYRNERKRERYNERMKSNDKN